MNTTRIVGRNEGCPVNPDDGQICAPDGIGGCQACDDGEGNYLSIEPVTDSVAQAKGSNEQQHAQAMSATDELTSGDCSSSAPLKP